ncbi:N-formylglutamate amidohydrolase [Ameyamaea chiangmaiensis]|uniref:N-formylglutamate amidohydrolase n=1 Tax=Ameyamaea chiangmaiensis TaxID=442969 RepID=A0A850PBA4_9PROT|nr:N-formylglutamate amidohydrolase [Ameyamaea chiangmaiensis]MBS4074854.1 N-formylglutamate amidohydrolase [Ameyamaea chiangmaiensis]NVN41807.1 N-formylglutamate amidohydrolase [Ameyamaea chiangmaiensis]
MVTGLDPVSLLHDDDPAPVRVFGASGASPFVLVSDHAGRAVPRALGDMGVSPADWERHIAWDIGMAGVGRALAERLDTILIEQVYSRLVIDCNRAPGHPNSVPEVSDGTVVSANLAIAEADRRAREDAILHPYQARIRVELEARAATGQPTALIALHSFTPHMAGVDRPWHAGVLHHRDPGLGRALRAFLLADGVPVVGDNEPYVLSDASDYTVPLHAETRGLPYVELEIRQDLVGDDAGQAEWADRLARLLPAALERYHAA